MNALRDIRIIPVVVVAIFGLAAMKLAGLMIDGGYLFSTRGARPADQASWAGSQLGFPAQRPSDGDVTGSVPAKKEEPKPEAKPAEPSPGPPPPPNALTDPPAAIPPTERAILERLQARRQELETRAREIEIRESLLKAAEKRIDGKTEEMKGTEARAVTEAAKGEADNAKLRNVVIMYEGMKPKDAAKVFDRLDMSVLIEIATQIAPRKMSDILGLMTAEAAEKLTVEMARRAGAGRPTSAAVGGELPKIEGRPIAPRN